MSPMLITPFHTDGSPPHHCAESDGQDHDVRRPELHAMGSPWYDPVQGYISPIRPTNVVCTLRRMVMSSALACLVTIVATTTMSILSLRERRMTIPIVRALAGCRAALYVSS